VYKQHLSLSVHEYGADDVANVHTLSIRDGRESRSGAPLPNARDAPGRGRSSKKRPATTGRGDCDGKERSESGRSGKRLLFYRVCAALTRQSSVADEAKL
jgi:hypothetical protein